MKYAPTTCRLTHEKEKNSCYWYPLFEGNNYTLRNYLRTNQNVLLLYTYLLYFIRSITKFYWIFHHNNIDCVVQVVSDSINISIIYNLYTKLLSLSVFNQLMHDQTNLCEPNFWYSYMALEDYLYYIHV